MSMSINGLASGLDTAGIVDQLMQLEAIPQTYVKQKKTATDNFVTALQALNAKVSSLSDNAEALTKANSFAKWTATSSSAHATVSAGETATLTDLEFKVNKLAQGQSILTGVVASAADLVDGSGNFTFTAGTGADNGHTVAVAADASLQDIATAVNGLNTGVRATVVSTADGQRLQLTNSTTGLEKGIVAITSGTGATAQTIKSAQDAEIELWPGLGLSGSIMTSASNTFENLATGVSVTVAKVHAADEDATTVAVAKDDTAITKLASNLVSQVGLVLSEISNRAKVTVDSSGSTTSATGGLFTGDAQTRMLSSQISDALSYPVGGKSPSTIGIEIQRDGTFLFKEDKFKEAMAADPEGTQEFLKELGTRVHDAAKTASDKYDGSLTLRVQSQQSLSATYTKQIEEWDLRLELRRATLNRTYSALEVALSNMQAQQSQLSSQLSSLSSSSS